MLQTMRGKATMEIARGRAVVMTEETAEMTTEETADPTNKAHPKGARSGWLQRG